MVSPAGYRRVTRFALWSLVFIVVTGAGVRLTGSGLGCPDWPTCADERVVAPFEWHPMVEFVNRTITGLVSVAVILAVLGSLRRAPRRRDLTLLSLGLVVGVVGQIVLGKVVVTSGLNPWVVQGHFALSMLLVLDAAVLAHRAGQPDDATVRPCVEPPDRRLGRVLAGLAAVVILTGTVVTGTGPHSGQNEGTFVRRLPVAVHDAARIHSVAMLAFLLTAVALLIRLRRSPTEPAVLRAAQSLLTVLVLQGAVGYTQYFTGVPPMLVALHVLGATLVWLAVVHLMLTMTSPVAEPGTHPRESGHGDDIAPHPTGRDLVTHR